MIRFMVLGCLFAAVICQDIDLEDVFADEDSEGVPTSQESACTKIDVDGKLANRCYECYQCNSENAKDQRTAKSKKQVEFKIHYSKDGKCENTTVCCFSQIESISRATDICGAYNPDGFPQVSRDRMRQVLPGEYPWRAWVYSKADLSKPMCGAVLINIEPAAFLTPAKCVEEDDPENLVVLFNKKPNEEKQYEVKSINLNEYYDSDTRYFDIAIISINANDVPLPTWVMPVCRSVKKPPFASTCITVSDDDNYINTIIPQQSKCVEGRYPLDDSFVCSVSDRNDYIPEFGGALICPRTSENKMLYYLYGITLYQSGDSGITIHTNTTHFYKWIDDTVSDINIKEDMKK